MSKQTYQHMEGVRLELQTALNQMLVFEGDRKKLSRLIARFTAQAVRHDRVHRSSTDTLAKIVDVFFNGRQA